MSNTKINLLQLEEINFATSASSATHSAISETSKLLEIIDINSVYLDTYFNNAPTGIKLYNYQNCFDVPQSSSSGIIQLVKKNDTEMSMTLFDFTNNKLWFRTYSPNDFLWDGTLERYGATGGRAVHTGSGTNILQGYYDDVSMGTISYDKNTNTFTGIHHPNQPNGSFVLQGSNNVINGYYATYDGVNWNYIPVSYISFDGETFTGSINFIGGTIATLTGSGDRIIGSDAYSGYVTLTGWSRWKEVSPSSISLFEPNFGWQVLSNGLLLQWGNGEVASSNNTNKLFPIVFPNNVFTMVCTDANGANIAGFSNLSKTGYTVRSNVPLISFSYLAIGY